MSETTKEIRETVNALMDCVDYVCEKFDISDEEQKKALDYVMDEIIMPGAAKTIVEKVVNAIWEDGEYEIRRTTSNRAGNRFNPSRNIYYSWGNKLDDLVFDTKEKAMRVKTSLEDYLETYGWVSVGYLFELMDEPASYTTEYYGWKNLDRASVRRVVNGWRLVLPLPVRDYSREKKNEENS